MSDKNLNALAEKVLKTMEDSTNSGAEMLPEEWSNTIIELIREDSWVRQLFANNTWKMRFDTEHVPKWTGAITTYGMSNVATSEPTASSPTTDSVELNMKTFMAKVLVKKKWLAYGIEQLSEHLEHEIVEEFVETEADAIVNGDTDTGATNINGQLVTNDLKLEFDGLRKQNFDASDASEITNVNASGEAISLSHIRSGFKNLGLYARKKSDLILLVSLNTGTTLLGFEELETLDKYGPKATIFSGEIGTIKLYGVKVIETDKIPTNLESTGKYDSGGSQDKTVAILFKRQTAMLGIPEKAERAFSIEQEKKPGLQQVNLYPGEDLAFNVQWRGAILQIINIAT